MKTIGSIDIVRSRKTRSDKGRHRKIYNKRPTIKFPKIRRNYSGKLKVWFWKYEKMSREGYAKWNRRVRPYIKPYICKFGIRADIPFELLSTQKLIEETVLEIIGYDGVFYMMGVSGCPRSRMGVKWVKLCKLVIRDSQQGLRCKMVENYRLWRYKFFWKGGR